MTAFPDAMGDICQWLIDHPVLAPLHGGRVYFVIPDADPDSPFMRLYRTGGGVQAGESPVQDIRCGLEAWATDVRLASGVRNLVAAIESALFDVQSPQLANLIDGTTILNAVVNAVVESPDPDTGWPRVVLDAVFTVRNA